MTSLGGEPAAWRAIAQDPLLFVQRKRLTRVAPQGARTGCEVDKAMPTVETPPGDKQGPLPADKVVRVVTQPETIASQRERLRQEPEKRADGEAIDRHLAAVEKQRQRVARKPPAADVRAEAGPAGCAG